MTKGVSFKITQIMGNVNLWPILKCINVKTYRWYNIKNQNEVWSDFQGNNFFDRSYYDGKSFSKQIRLKHYIVFLKLQAYFNTGEFYNIHTYEEFLKSDCHILLLINDCEFVEIFTKELTVTKAVYENALSNNYAEVKYITEYNDGRTKMDVL